jgi:hypothetical protein
MPSLHGNMHPPEPVKLFGVVLVFARAKQFPVIRRGMHDIEIDDAIPAGYRRLLSGAPFAIRFRAHRE